MAWRLGSKVNLNIYDGADPGRPVCQCHNPEDAMTIVNAVNMYQNAVREAVLRCAELCQDSVPAVAERIRQEFKL